MVLLSKYLRKLWSLEVAYINPKQLGTPWVCPPVSQVRSTVIDDIQRSMVHVSHILEMELVV